MKKLFLTFAICGLFSAVAPKIANAGGDDCATYIMVCTNGSQHYVVICDEQDEDAWGEILCS